MARAKTLTFQNPGTSESVTYEIDDARVGSDVFSTSKSYAVGDFCIYENVLYRCKTNVTAGSDFDNTKWRATTIVDEIVNRVLHFSSVSVAATTGDIVTINDSRITADHVVTNWTWGNAKYITTAVTYTTTDGQLKLNGTCTTATTVTLTLEKKDN